MPNIQLSRRLRQISRWSVIVGALGGCSSTSTPVSGIDDSGIADSGIDDSGIDDGTNIILPGGGCGTSIEAVQKRATSPPPGPACPARFDDVMYRRIYCNQSRVDHAGPCGGALVYTGVCGFDRFVCVYDVASHELVGASTSTDTNAFCDAKSSCLTGGILPPEIICSIDRLDPSACNLPPLPSDGGSPDASTDATSDGGDVARM